ncbi:MAG: glycosyltransferase [Candidatus Omnitrophica bacterium]|nr:glycosyltransferase [Candidatus Omnitrophota bacterium]
MADKAVRALYISYNAITEPIVESQVIPYLRELSKKKIKFYLLTYEKSDMTKEAKEQLKERLKKESNLEWFSLRYHKKPVIPATFFDIILGCFYSMYIAAKNRVGVIHARAIVAALAGFPAAKLLGRKFIFDTRGIDSEEYVDAGLWKRDGLKHKIAGFLEGVLTKSADHVIVLTNKFLGILKEKYRNKNISFSVIPCAVDTDEFGVGSGNPSLLAENFGIRDSFVIVYIGSLGTWYMLEEMVDFFKVADKFVENAHFLLLTPAKRDYVQDILDKKGISACQVSVHTVKHSEIPKYLPACNLGIFFIKPVFSKLSSSPVKFAEYLSSRLPVVINSGIGDTDQIVKRRNLGAVIDKFCEESYSKAIKAVLDMLRSEKDALRSRCREAAEKELSLSAAVERYHEIYKGLLLK